MDYSFLKFKNSKVAKLNSRENLLLLGKYDPSRSSTSWKPGSLTISSEESCKKLVNFFDAGLSMCIVKRDPT